MTNVRNDIVKIIEESCPGDGFHGSPIPGIHCIKISETGRRTKRHWRASLFIVVQGCKEIILGHETYRNDQAHYIVTAIDLPVSSRVVSATPEQPFLCLKIDFDTLNLNEFVTQLDQDERLATDSPLRSVFMGTANESMLEAVHRLCKLFKNSEDAPVLANLVIKEILYHVLKGPDGPAIRQFVRSGSTMHKISQAIHSLIAELTFQTDVGTLAKTVNMSRSAFFKHFKEVTAMSPIQYQKRLRLLEARRLMTDEGESAEGSAFKVGYNSPSQFSREYSRMFGNSPLRDVVKIKAKGQSIHSM